MREILLMICAAVALAADDPKPATAQISAELRAEIWRARTERIFAEWRAEKAREVELAALAKARKECGDRDVVDGKDGEPACAAKQEPAKVPAK